MHYQNFIRHPYILCVWLQVPLSSSDFIQTCMILLKSVGHTVDEQVCISEIMCTAYEQHWLSVRRAGTDIYLLTWGSWDAFFSIFFIFWCRLHHLLSLQASPPSFAEVCWQLSLSKLNLPFWDFCSPSVHAHEYQSTLVWKRHVGFCFQTFTTPLRVFAQRHSRYCSELRGKEQMHPLGGLAAEFIPSRTSKIFKLIIF